ncbi:MAG: methylmalonyl Co-A mutase-associated GTPase MeaB [Epsilonproteobacteria bacterium]|nr:methylmalonyl Co-A mutase-associated GTPase MeaB [Campylobacterota bacterium]
MTTVENSRRQLAQLIRKIEEGEEFSYYTKRILSRTIGITGSGGVGKSTLITRLIQHYREKRKKVAVVATDPSSPFSGGALLGDRIRMQRFATDPNVFIKSVASRGKQGGIALSTGAIASALSESKYDPIIIETLGIGQDEIDVSKLVDTSIVMFSPRTGDQIQAMKAGIMEIGDIFVVNKADMPAADAMAAQLTKEISESGRRVEIIKTIATTGEGIDKLLEAIEKHQKLIDAVGKKKESAVYQIESILRDKIYCYIKESLQKKNYWDKAIKDIINGESIAEIIKQLV